MKSINSMASTLGLATAVVLGGCAHRGGSQPDGSAAEPEGIQTRPLRSAPPTVAPHNESRPLSELNTPEAIAARQGAAGSGQAVNAAAAARPAAGPPPPFAPPLAAGASMTTPAVAPAHQKIAGVQKGAKVRLRSAAMIRSRPNLASDGVAANASGEVELQASIYNADGYWWYVTVGSQAGWLLQTDIQR